MYSSLFIGYEKYSHYSPTTECSFTPAATHTTLTEAIPRTPNTVEQLNAEFTPAPTILVTGLLRGRCCHREEMAMQLYV